MIPMSLGAVAAAVRGQLTASADGDARVSDIAIDSRQATRGALFAALRGEHADGHDFVADAITRGAAAALTSRPTDAAAIVVDDVVGALGSLASHVRRLLSATVIGVTGSSGKTSTKDLLAQVLQRWGDTVAPVASYNNEIGVPLTLLRATEATRFLVLEMSARGSGHIRALCDIAPLHIGLVLNVGTAHLGEFGSVDAIAAAKAEIVDGIAPGGDAVLNADDPRVAAMAVRTRGRVVTFGRTPRADVRAVDIRLDAAGRPAFTLVTRDGSADVRLHLVGVHHVSNALAVAAVSRIIGMPLRDVAQALEDARAVSRWRMEVHELPDGVTVVNDAYNANPDSTSAALRALVAITASHRRWAVLGEMAELGAAATVEHARIGRLVVALGIDRLVTVGDGARPIYSAAVDAGMATTDVTHVHDAPSAVASLREGLERGDVVLVKGSRVAGLERVALALTGERVPA
ncbi:MAG: UDP-N-acetylmuramoyl-tripeptide--D-alanyl-D-alanine ligase [Mycobacteriales bacterium]